MAIGLPTFTGALDHVLVVPTDRDGRPGYRLTTAGTSTHVRTRTRSGRTYEFTIAYAAHSVLTGMCSRRTTDDDLSSRVDEAIRHVLTTHPDLEARCVLEPSPSELAGEPAVVASIEHRLRGGGRIVTTDWNFDRGDWHFTVGRMHNPVDPPETRTMADAILASWTWLPEITTQA